jgi:hypothetical protein
MGEPIDSRKYSLSNQPEVGGSMPRAKFFRKRPYSLK